MILSIILGLENLIGATLEMRRCHGDLQLKILMMPPIFNKYQHQEEQQCLYQTMIKIFLKVFDVNLIDLSYN